MQLFAHFFVGVVIYFKYIYYLVLGRLPRFLIGCKCMIECIIIYAYIVIKISNLQLMIICITFAKETKTKSDDKVI